MLEADPKTIHRGKHPDLHLVQQDHGNEMTSLIKKRKLTDSSGSDQSAGKTHHLSKRTSSSGSISRDDFAEEESFFHENEKKSTKHIDGGRRTDLNEKRKTRLMSEKEKREDVEKGSPGPR